MKLKTKFEGEDFKLGEVVDAVLSVTAPAESGGKHTFRYATIEELEEDWGSYEDAAPAVAALAEEWDKKAIKTKVGLLVAPENYKEGTKEHFTWDEAMGVQEKMKTTGWRLPTMAEWTMLYGAYGIDKEGEDDPESMRETLRLPLAGTYYGGSSLGNTGSYGCYWSSTEYDSLNAYYLLLNSGTTYVYPSFNYDKYYGFSVRMVKEEEC